MTLLSRRRRALRPALAAAVLLALAPVLTPVLAAATTPSPAAADPAPHAGDDGWSVRDLGGRYEVSWTSPTRFPLGSDRPVVVGDGLRFGPPTVDADGRTVRAVVTAHQAPDPADLDVVLSGERLDERRGPIAARAPGRRLQEAQAPLAAPDPALPGPFGVATSDYELEPVRVAGLREPVEMVGHVVEPAAGSATGPRPLVLFMHGRHGVCYRPDKPRAGSFAWPCRGRFEEIPSQLGYDYIQRTLASRGFATVSVRVNGINAQDDALLDGGAAARAQLVRAHLDHWVGLAASHQVDLGRVVLVGHSRGGEGVDRASVQIPLDAPYRIAGQVLIAPTDFGVQSAPFVPTVTLLPSCDGDVSDLQGQRFVDAARDLAPADPSLKSSVLVFGANHNFFNTEWTPATAVAPASDDWFGRPHAACGSRSPERLSGAEQRAVGLAYVAGAVRLFTGEDAYLPQFDGSPVRVPSVGGAVVLTHAVGGGRELRRPGVEATPTIPVRAVTSLCVGDIDSSQGSCGRGAAGVVPHWTASWESQPTRRFLEVGWRSPGAAGGLRFDADPLDLTDRRVELRGVVDPRRGDVDVRLRLTDGAGASAVLTPLGGTRVRALPTVSGRGLYWARTIAVDPAGSGLDLRDVVAVEVLGESQDGRLWVADVAAAPARPVAVGAERLPRLSLERMVRVREGDPQGDRASRTRVVRLPFRIEGTLRTPARFVVSMVGQTRGSKDRFVVDVAAGQTHGTIPVAVPQDRVIGGYGGRWSDVQVSAWALDGLMTDRYLGTVRVLEDDRRPTPVRPPRRG